MITIDTETLIQELAGGTGRVRPLPRPWVRAAVWLAIAVPSALLLVVLISSHADWVSRLVLPRVIGEEVFALATGVFAAIAAFASVVPGYNRKVLLLPLVPLVLWLGGLGQNSVREWLQLTTHGFSMRSEWICLPGIVAAGAVPAIAMIFMLRRGAPLAPRTTFLLGGLAAAGIGNLGVCVTHHAYENVLVLVWHLSIVMVVSACIGSLGARVFNWHALVERTRKIPPVTP